MQTTIYEECRDEIMNDILFILDSIRNDRSFLNKHFQNSICNYFLEDYAGSFLKEQLGIVLAKDVTKYIAQKYASFVGTKYMKLMHGYFEELKLTNNFKQFQSLLLSNIFKDQDRTNKGSKEWQSVAWKRAFSLFIYHASLDENKELKGIFEIWNSLQPNNQIQRKRQENINHRPELKKKQIQQQQLQQQQQQQNQENVEFQEQRSRFEEETCFSSNMNYINESNQCDQISNLGSSISFFNQDHDEDRKQLPDLNGEIDFATTWNSFGNNELSLIDLIREANQGHILPELDGLSEYLKQKNEFYL